MSVMTHEPSTDKPVREGIAGRFWCLGSGQR